MYDSGKGAFHDGRTKNKEELWMVSNQDPGVMISNLGRVKRKNKIVSVGCDVDGYKRLKIKGKMYRLHRLVAELFIPNPDNLPLVDHIDNDRKNNRWDNLRWCTHQQNSQWAADMGLQSRNKSKDTVTLVYKDKQGYIFHTNIEAAKFVGCDVYVLSKLCSNKLPHYNNFRAIRLDKLNDMRNDKN